MKKSTSAVIAVLVLGMLLLFGKTASSQTSSVKLTVVAGFDGKYVGSWPVPVEAEIESVRAFAGDFWVRTMSARGSQHVWEMPIEVPAGGKKVYRMLVDPGVQIFAGLERDGKTILARPIPLSETDQLLIGVIGGPVPSGLAALQRDAAQSPLASLPISDEWLDFGSPALQHLGYLVIDTEQLGSPTEKRRKTLLDWVTAGGRLIVSSPDPDKISWIPKEWLEQASGGSTIADSGFGEVTFAPSISEIEEAQSWTAYIRPFGRPSLSEESQSQNPHLFVAGALSNTSRDPVRLPWVVVFLAVYVFTVGPAAYIFVKRIGRRELMWVIVPGMALVFSIFGFLVSKGSRGEDVLRQANIVFATPERNIGERIAVSASSSGSEQRVGFGSQFSTSLTTSPRIGQGSTTRVGPDGHETHFSLTPFEIAAAKGSGAEAEGYLDATLKWDGTGFHGSITNRTPYDFSEIRLIMGGMSTNAGTLAAGATGSLSILPRRPDQHPNLTQNMVLSAYHPYFYNSLSAGTGSNVAPSLVAALYSQLGIDPFFAPPIVAGITEELRPTLSLDGRKVKPPGVSVMASTVKLELPSGVTGKILPSAGHGLLVGKQTSTTGPSQSMMSGGFSSQGGSVLSGPGESVYLWRLPDQAIQRPLSSPKLWVGVDIQSSQRFVPPQQSGSSSSTSSQLGSLRFEVFDWSKQSWNVFQAQPAGSSSHDIPFGSISPLGETLIRFSPGALSLELWSFGVEVDVG